MREAVLRPLLLVRVRVRVRVRVGVRVRARARVRVRVRVRFLLLPHLRPLLGHDPGQAAAGSRPAEESAAGRRGCPDAGRSRVMRVVGRTLSRACPGETAAGRR
eukprot:scaffold39596_cov39-Phaeocystis_antarctica.AAC.1